MLPKTINGKLDTARLPKVSQSSLLSNERPRNDLEAELCRIWASILKMPTVGIRNDFFKTRGDSISAIRLVYEINQQTGMRVAVRDIFEHPTIASLTEHFQTNTADEKFIPYVELLDNLRKGPILFLLSPFEGGAECYFRNLVANLPASRIVAFNNLRIHEPHKRHTYKKLAARYLVWMREVQPHGPYHLGGWSMGGLLAFEISLQLAQTGEKTQSLCMIDPYFSLERTATELGIGDYLVPVVGMSEQYEPRPEDVQPAHRNIKRLVLFKAAQVNDRSGNAYQRKIFEAVLSEHYNGLDYVVPKSMIERVVFEAGHYSWTDNEPVVRKIAEVFQECLSA